MPTSADPISYPALLDVEICYFRFSFVFLVKQQARKSIKLGINEYEPFLFMTYFKCNMYLKNICQNRCAKTIPPSLIHPPAQVFFGLWVAIHSGCCMFNSSITLFSCSTFKNMSLYSTLFMTRIPYWNTSFSCWFYLYAVYWL